MLLGMLPACTLFARAGGSTNRSLTFRALLGSHFCRDKGGGESSKAYKCSKVHVYPS